MTCPTLYSYYCHNCLLLPKNAFYCQKAPSGAKGILPTFSPFHFTIGIKIVSIVG